VCFNEPTALPGAWATDIVCTRPKAGSISRKEPPMKRYLAIVAAGALTFGGYVFAQNAPADQPNAVERTGKAIEHGAEKTGEAIKEGAEKAKDAVTPERDAEAAASKN